MKQIILNDNNDTILAKDVTPNHYIGVINRGQRGFVTKTEYHDGQYTLRCLDVLTKGNGWDYYDNDTLQGVLAAVLAVDEGNKAFVFFSPIELVNWLLEEYK